MHKNVIRLMELMPPPPKIWHNSGYWDRVEQELGTAFPADFKDFVQMYGSVEVCDWLWFHTPFALVESYSELIEKRLTREIDPLRQIFSENEIPPPYPQPGGILPAGTTEDADMIAWITRGHPDQWGVFFSFSGGLATFSFPALSVTGFLLELLELKSPLFEAGLDSTPFEEDSRHVDASETFYPTYYS